MQKLLALFCLLYCCNIANAQFMYSSRDGDYTKSGTVTIEIDNPTSEVPLNPATQKEILEQERERDILDSFIVKTGARYQKIKRKIAEGKRIEDLKSSDRSIYLLHENRSDIKEIAYEYQTNFRTSKSITPQVLSGLSLVNNTLSDENSGVIELGAKINNTRISLPTKFKYNVDEINGEFKVKRVQKDRYLYFDFISRGLLSLDSLQKTMSEYVNTTQGSPLVLRLNFQQRLTPSYLDPAVTRRREPVFFLNLDFDGRLVPVSSSTKIEEAGGSFHIMPSLIAVFPSGEISSNRQEDNFIIQLTFNAAYLSNNLKEAMTLASAENPFAGNWALSTELRAGNFSEKNPLRNWSVFAKYTWQEIVGSQFSFGFAFAPQGTKEKENEKN